MHGKFPALRDTFARQSTAGNIILLLMAIYLIFPYIDDRLRGEPAIVSELAAINTDLGLIIQDKIIVKRPNRGTRSNLVLDKNNTIICAKNWSSIWNKPRTREWTLESFAGCATPVTVPFRVCSVFTVNSRAGIYRKFGDDYEFCTNLVNPA